MNLITLVEAYNQLLIQQESPEESIEYNSKEITKDVNTIKTCIYYTLLYSLDCRNANYLKLS